MTKPWGARTVFQQKTLHSLTTRSLAKVGIICTETEYTVVPYAYCLIFFWSPLTFTEWTKFSFFEWNYAFKKFKLFLNPTYAKPGCVWFWKLKLHLIIRLRVCRHVSHNRTAPFVESVLCPCATCICTHITLPMLEFIPTGHTWDVGHWLSDSNLLPCSPSIQSVDILVTILSINRSLFCSVRFWSAQL